MIILYPRHAGAADTIDDYARLLAAAMRAQGMAPRVQSHLCPRSAGLVGGGARTTRRSRQVLWQYNPYSYGWKGLAPWAAALPLRVRLLGQYQTCVTFHEMLSPLLPLTSLSPVRSVVQRLMCLLIGVASDAMVVTTGNREARLRRWFPRRHHLIARIPVGPTLPVAPEGRRARATTRRGLGAADGTLLVGTFGSAEGGLLLDTAIRTVADLRQRGVPVRLAILGQAAADPTRVASLNALARSAGIAEHVVAPGRSPADVISHQLSALDLLLAPYADGVSGRRTALAAALAHGLPVIGNAGKNTDHDWFRPDEAVRFATSSSPAHLADSVAGLAGDPARRAQLALGAHRVFQRTFSWSAIASQYRQHLSRALSERNGGAARRGGVGPV